ncbi:MAG TPA: EamA family transporter [Thermoanaerobaculia bacterium]|nr:EamA family transporter [Thermoanaerobaculia bacterium]
MREGRWNRVGRGLLLKHEKALAWFAFAVVCIVWGTTYLAIRVAIETIPPLMLTCMRFVVAGIVMLGIAAWRGERIPRDLRTIADLTLVGFLMVGLGNLAVAWAEQWVPSGMAALFVATAPFWMVVIEAFRRNGERINLRSGIGMLMGFAGVGLLVTPEGAGGVFDRHFVLGAVAIQLGGIAWQLGSVRGKYTLKHVPLLASAGLQMLSGGIIVAIAGFALGEHTRLTFNTKTLAAYIYLTLFGSIIAYSAYVYALAKLRTTQTSLYAYVNPVVAVILGWLILNERLTIVSVLAMIVILAGVALVQTALRPQASGLRPRETALPPPVRTPALHSE